ncbi:MAG: relaxase/mobilization nuclease domain-containing protein [bacterium]|nr:relaxase/mobilization nuclease domain-containing protein [bacterium]
MAQGIVAKIWNVSVGSGTRSASAQISSSIDYIENPEKVGVTLGLTTVNQISNELSYVANEIKTVQGLYIGTRHISEFQNATNEMMQVKEFYGKLDGRVATHGVISLDEAESDPKNAGKLMLLLDDLMKQVFPENQVVYAVHTNTENLHIHFILNTVGMDGKKIHMDHNFMKKVFEPTLNGLAEQYGFTPNSTWSQTPKKDVVPFPTRKIWLREMIDDAIAQTDDIASCIAYLRSKELTVNVGKNISVQMEGMPKAIRTGTLGENYTINGIVRRIATKMEPLVWKSIGSHSHYLPEREMMNFIPVKMKNYKKMSAQEKVEAIRLIKLKRNPWEESYKDNWAIQSMSKQLNQVAYVFETVHYYSHGTDSTTTAMEEILKQRKQLAIEKKSIRKNMSEYKPIIAIYEEMKQYMLRAYLYDAYGRTEYLDDFKKYKELSERLEKLYGKTVEEVADFMIDQKNQLLYAKAQEAELSAQYRAIKNYVSEGRFNVKQEGLSFYKAVGHSEALRNAREYNVLTSDIRYITARGVNDITIRVITTPELMDEKTSIVTTVTVLGADNTKRKEISSKDMDAKTFQEATFNLAKEYELRDCKISKKNSRGNIL